MKKNKNNTPFCDCFFYEERGRIMQEKIKAIYLQQEKNQYTISELAQLLNVEENRVKKEIKILEKEFFLYKNGCQSYRLIVYNPDQEQIDQYKKQILKLLAKKRLSTFHEIKKSLQLYKKEHIIFLRKLLSEMTLQNEIYHSHSRGFYALEKIEYFSKEMLNQHILQILNQHSSISYNKLKKKLHLTKEDNEYHLIALLQELEYEGKFFSKNGKFYKMTNHNYLADIIDIWGDGTILAAIINDDSLIKIPFENANGVLKYDRVILKKEENNSYTVEKIVKRQNPKIVCEVVLEEDKKIIKPYHMLTTVKPRISSIDMDSLVCGDLILVKVSLDEVDGYYEAYLEKVVGNVNDPGIDLKCIALNFGFNEEFSLAAKEELLNIPTCVQEKEIENRKDLRNKVIFTIDDVTCKDMDDAISLETLENGNYKLGVHIADVTHYIKPDSQLYQEAKERGTSLYMINTSIPMLPRKITNGILSLNPKEDRLTFTCEMILSPQGQVLDYDIFESVIHSCKKMSYQEVNKVLEGNTSEEYKPYEKLLLQMNKLSLILEKRKKERGYLEFASTEEKFIEDHLGNVKDIEKRQQKDAEKIIENFMILANEVVDTHLFWLGLPKMARTHQEPNEKKLANVIDILKTTGYKIPLKKDIPLKEQISEILYSLRSYEEFPILSNMILRCMARAKYTTNSIGHFGLQLNRYMHFTSPIRRFPDLETHYLLKLYHSKNLEHVNLDLLEKNLKLDAEYLSNREQMAQQAENEAIALKNTLFYENKIGEEVIGYITNFSYKKILVQSRDLVNGIVRIKDIATCNLGRHGNRSLDYRIQKDHLKIGSKVLLEIKEVDKNEKIVYFILKKNLSWKKDNDLKRQRILETN